VFPVAVVVVREPTVHPRTALRRVVRLDLLYGDAALRRFVRDVLEQATERPDVVPLRVRKSLSNVSQILEHDNVAVVFDGFRNEFVGDRVDILFSPRVFALAEPKQGVVGGLRAALLHLSTPLFELAAPVVVVVSLPERAGGGDGEAVDAKVDTEDRLVGVPGICRNLCVAVYPPSRNVEVKLVGRRIVPNRTLTELIVSVPHKAR
jgi:hypothetical protein